MYQTSWRYDPQFLRYRVRQTQIGIYGSFFTLLTPPLKKKKKKPWKIKFQKSEKVLEISSFYTVCTKNHNHEVQFLRYRVRQTFLWFWALFCPFSCLVPQKSKLLEIWKKELDMSPFHTYVLKITIIWCMAPEIWRATESIVILSHFLPLYYTDNLKNQNFEKMKKTPWDIIILHMYTINENHMMYGSWNMECNRQNFYSFWNIFCPFAPNNPENQNFEKMKKSACRYHNSTKVYQKSWSYAILFLRYGMRHV